MTGDLNIPTESGEPLRRPADLAALPDLVLGDATIRPAVRTIEGPARSIATEPRVMQGLVALAQAGGAVVTRQTLERRCWGGVMVSDGSINRAAATARRAIRESGAGIGIETVPRIGYRLTVAPPPAEPETDGSAFRISRRRAIALGAGGVMCAVMAGSA